MKARDFKEVNVEVAKDQDEYQTLPAMVTDEIAITSFKLSEEEIQQVIETGTIYLQLYHCKKPITPIGQSVLNPFIKPEKPQSEDLPICPEKDDFGRDYAWHAYCITCRYTAMCEENHYKNY